LPVTHAQHASPSPDAPTTRDRKDAAEFARDYMELLSPLLTVEEADLREGLRLFQEGTGSGSFDAVLAAAARAAGAEALVSAGTGFSGIAAIHHVVPDTDGVRGLLAAPGDSLQGSRTRPPDLTRASTRLPRIR
jgi:hypothetical protein